MGTPWFDVGFALTHALAKALWSPLWRRQFLQGAEAFWDGYRQPFRKGCCPGWGRSPQDAGTLQVACWARAVGRSRLEYLDHAQLDRQRSLALRLMANPPSTIPYLIREVAGLLGET